MQLRINQLSHVYAKKNKAIDKLNLTFSEGITGLLGPNGAGKSSLLRILATLTKPSDGSIELDGKDIFSQLKSYRGKIGYLPQYFGVYENLSANEFLSYLAAIKGMKPKAAKQEIAKRLSDLNLAQVADQAMHTYSGGMRQRVGICQALLNKPKIVIFDEPTVGLDPEERARFRDILVDVSNESIVLLSTHIVSDVESIADNIAIMQLGECKAVGKSEALINTLNNKVSLCTIDANKLSEYTKRYCVTHRVRKGSQYQLRIVHDATTSGGQLDCPSEIVTPTLEDVYSQLVTKQTSGA